MSSTSDLLWVALFVFILGSAFLLLVGSRRRSVRERSSIWVVACEERSRFAIVALRSASGHTQVTECSDWRENPRCSKACLMQLMAKEQVRLLSR